MPEVIEREEFFEKCDCGEDHENKFIEGLLLVDDNNKFEFTAALLNHDEDKHVWMCIFLNGCKEITDSACYVTAHIFMNDSGVCFSIQDGDRSPFSKLYEDDIYRVSREEAISVDGLKDAFVFWYQSLFKADTEIGSYLLLD